MKGTKAHIIAAAASLLLAAAQFCWAATGQDQNDSVHDFGPWSTAVYTAPSGGTTHDFDSGAIVPGFNVSETIVYQSEYFQDNDVPQIFGYGISHTYVSIAQDGNEDMLMYLDMGLNPAAALDVFSNIPGIPACEYVLYPPNQRNTQFVQYGLADGLENNELAGDFVVGPLTPIATLNDFQNGQVVAVYFGGTYNNEAFASVTANFGTGTWSGVFLGTFDVAVSGSIEGQFFSSDSVTGFRDNSTPVSGMVAGSFYGPAADQIAGVIDIARNGERIVDLFDGQKVDINLPAN